tara:strand:- start:15 stop:224 length:210 start_codon:yes stop_codon:yes gene_type:complete
MTLYCALINNIKTKYSDPQIDQLHFTDEDEAKDFIVDEYQHKYGIDLQKSQIEVYKRASQRLDRLPEGD